MEKQIGERVPVNNECLCFGAKFVAFKLRQALIAPVVPSVFMKYLEQNITCRCIGMRGKAQVNLALANSWKNTCKKKSCQSGSWELQFIGLRTSPEGENC